LNHPFAAQAVGGAPLTKVARKQKALGFLRRDRPCGVPPPGPVTAHAPNCVEINQWNALSSKNFKPLSRSNRGRFGGLLDESIALVEFSKHCSRSCVEDVAYAHIEVGLKI
jgi:hypothetical protein